MSLLAILTAIVSGIGAIGGAVIDTGKAILDAMMSFFQTIFSILQSFIISAPTPMKIFIFMFFLLTIGNIFSGFLLGVQYACDSSNLLYETTDITKAMTLPLKTQFTDMSTQERDTFIHDNFELATPTSNPTRIKCTSTKPRLYFYSIDILSYPMWLLILVIIFGLPLIWGYYQKMGALR